MTDPILGRITASEAAALLAKWSAVKASMAIMKEAVGVFEQTLLAAIVTDPVVEPEPPIEVPPAGDYGGSGPYPLVLDIGQFGGTPGDKAMHEWADNGGNLMHAEIIGGQGSAVSNHNQGTTHAIYGGALLVRASPMFGTDWLSRTYNRSEEWADCTFTALGTPFHKEGHGRYGCPTGQFISRKCLNERLYGNPIQLAYRPGAEPGGPVQKVFIDDRFVNCHAPVDAAGNRSDRAGPIVALYGLGQECEHTVIQDQLQDLWPQMGPSCTCVPEGAKDPATGQMLPPWWSPNQWTDRRLTVLSRGKILAPVHQELYRVAGVRTVSLEAELVLLGGGPPRILIDPLLPETGQLLYGAKPAESVRVDVRMTRPDGSKVPCPVEFQGKLIGTTADGVLTGGVPISTHG